MTQASNILWQATAGKPVPVTRLTESLSRDVVVIGGGIMGTTAALELARASKSCALLEASHIGNGASSRPGGFVVPHFSFGSPETIRTEMGNPGNWIIEAVGNSAATVFDLIRTCQIDCDAHQTGWFQPAHSDAAMRHIEQVAAEWRAHGFDNELLDTAETERRTGVAGYKGSWFTPGGGTIHPQKYTLGLARAARKLGADIFQDSRVITLEKDKGKFRVSTLAGEVIADHVLICTNGLSDNLSPALEKSVVRMPVWQCATEPIPEAQRRHLFKNGECLSDTRTNLFTYRFDRDWRLITGALEPFGVSPDRIGQAMAGRLQKYLGLPERPRIDYLWRGIASVTSTRLPEIVCLPNGAISASACNGRGIAMSTVYGTAMAAAVSSGETAALPPGRADNPSRLGVVCEQLMTGFYPYYAMVKDWLDR